MKHLEPRWPSLAAFIGVALLFYALPDALSLGPKWLMLTVIGALLVPTIVTHRLGMDRWNHILGQILTLAVTLGLIYSLIALITGLPSKREPPLVLLKAAGSLWMANILVFASWYWRLDAGGPYERSRREKHSEGCFSFPQMTDNAADENWRPHFVDYLFLAFNTSTAFSPTDTSPLTQWGKALMMIQSLIALGSLVVLAARALNTL